MTFYERFRQIDLDVSRLGLQTGDTDRRYFCTPRGAEIIGWAGVDGIHYCFIAGFGEMVFSVNPMNLPGEYVYPLAKTFEDFLRLLLACGSLDVLEQAYRLDREGFDCEVWEAGFLEDEEVRAREILQNDLSLTPMPEPYNYIRDLQASFDYSAIPYTDAYTVWGPEEESPQEWAVYYDHDRSGRAGQEVPVRADFLWNGNPCHIPAIYLCGKGLVIDFCMQVEPERMRAFLDQWPDPDGRERSEDEQEQMRAKNPLAFNFSTQAVINGRTLRWRSSCGLVWFPPSCRAGGYWANADDAQAVRHYRLDIDKVWDIRRVSLPWATKRKPSFRRISLHLEPENVNIPGPRFAAPEPGKSFSFTNPVSGSEHTLTVLEYEQGEIDPERFQNSEMEYPCHYAAMTYELSPDIPRDKISIQDCDRGDSPRRKHPKPGVLSSSSGILFASSRGEARAAVSSLHFQPVEHVEWRMTFFEKPQGDVDVEISLDKNDT